MKLEIKNVSYRYTSKGRQILKDFSLSMENTERVGLTAPSGYGKTTLCQLLSGYLKPNQGEILLDGRPLDSYQGYCPVQMVWQQPEFAVNPRLPLGEAIKEGDEIEERVIRGLGIEPDWFGRFPTELSGGELQRFSLARALGKRTRFLIADEISTMLDLITQSQIWHFLVEEVEKRQIGLIAVSHNPELIDRVCTRKIDLRLLDEKNR
ncbi:MAG TPA: ABC transporter ATP-binding protein [Lachnospiraceae bacterium]|nr:ABC transporter ATP-binding protein [Lachnospiraceae bacterium]